MHLTIFWMKSVFSHCFSGWEVTFSLSPMMEIKDAQEMIGSDGLMCVTLTEASTTVSAQMSPSQSAAQSASHSAGLISLCLLAGIFRHASFHVPHSLALLVICWDHCYLHTRQALADIQQSFLLEISIVGWLLMLKDVSTSC